MTFILDEIKHLLRCAHCLNHGASSRVIIQDKKAPNGEESGPNGEAVAYMCDTHKTLPPKFAHQILDGKVNNINVEQLADMPPLVKEGDPNYKFSKDEVGDEGVDE